MKYGEFKILLDQWLRLQYGVMLVHWWHLKDNVQKKDWWKEQYKISLKRLFPVFNTIFTVYLLAQAGAHLYIAFIVGDPYAGDAAVAYALAGGYFAAWISSIKSNERMGEFVDGVIDAARQDISKLQGEVRYWMTRSTMKSDI